MRASDYEALMVKGWRRCGNYYYKPDIAGSCCKLNTIRCLVGEYTANKTQNKVSKKFYRFLHGIPSNSDKKKAKKPISKLIIPLELQGKVENAVKKSVEGLCEYSADLVRIIKNIPARAKQFGDYSVSSCIIISGKNKSIDKVALLQKMSQELESGLENTQWSILNTENSHINIKDSNPSGEMVRNDIVKESPMDVQLPKHEYTSEIVPADFTEESFEVYKEYQIAIHKDLPSSITRSGYENFLCGKNLIYEKPTELYPLGLGNFHQLHRIDGKLVAVGVLDFLPSGVSAVYFFYSPKYSHLTLGTLGALKEIELIRANLTTSFAYYYMGFYIYTCQKMRYKGEFIPSQLLCPKNYVWVDIQDCLKNVSHNFNSLHQCSEKTLNQKDSDMDWTTENFVTFLEQHLQIEIGGKSLKVSALNDRGRGMVIGMMMEAQAYLPKSMMKRLVFKLN
jgi:arginine-tRNA-protein transferase